MNVEIIGEQFDRIPQLKGRGFATLNEDLLGRGKV
jgi:hypothetical protein